MSSLFISISHSLKLRKLPKTGDFSSKYEITSTPIEHYLSEVDSVYLRWTTEKRKKQMRKFL